MKKRGQGLSITTIIVAAIALVVLVVLIAVFAGRFSIFDRGVSNVGACTGTIDCNQFSDANSCEGVGCTWDPNEALTCSGTPSKSCVSYVTQESCETLGCSWSGSE